MATILMISMIKVEKLMCDGCKAYLAFVTTDEGSKRKLSEVAVVFEFQEVFLDDLLGLPS